MRLWCKIGWHAAQDGGLWNRGLYFSRCRHCGRDLIRTFNGRWHEPRGFRVVWGSPDQAPAPPTSKPIIPEADRTSGASMVAKEPWEARIEKAARRRIASLDVGDFMGDTAALSAKTDPRQSIRQGEVRARKAG